jgi:hypothetical protein
MRHFALLLGIIFPNVIVADQLTINVPSAVANTIREYRAECTDEGGALELDGDEISMLRTDEGEEAYVIHAAFTCGDLGHLWCGAMGCPTDLVINNKFYGTNRILQKHPTRISKASDGTVTYWMPDGLKLMVER